MTLVVKIDRISQGRPERLVPRDLLQEVSGSTVSATAVALLRQRAAQSIGGGDCGQDGITGSNRALRRVL